ncbi:hypothetical protein KIN20_037469 [Parelaphostrongylus tenuis]|uniref:Peptidase A2 domain-containing protein n=1 Tax=Parelaphostrongylus tenuis TaxID=148309 RepID=A0AAD5RES7_PARTN|nr:hypothetical protein KIN20_037469 [Parelaphostrongylus tenuis]
MQATMLSTEKLAALNPTRNRLEKLHVLLDTGGELSFIDEKVAQELHQPVIDEVKLCLSTFGPNKVQKQLARKVSFDLWDVEGNQLSLSLLTHSIMTK